MHVFAKSLGFCQFIRSFPTGDGPFVSPVWAVSIISLGTTFGMDRVCPLVGISANPVFVGVSSGDGPFLSSVWGCLLFRYA